MGEGLQEGIDFTVLKRTRSYLVKENKNIEAGLLSTIASGGIFSPQRATAIGYPTRCPMCGKENANDAHMFWHCPHIIRDSHSAIVKSN